VAEGDADWSPVFIGLATPNEGLPPVEVPESPVFRPKALICYNPCVILCAHRPEKPWRMASLMVIIRQTLTFR